MWSKYFAPAELIISATAAERGIANIPTWSQLHTLHAFCVCCLDEVRSLAGRAVVVTSGYRCPQLNHAVGGVDDSHHQCWGGYAAADITLGNVDYNCKLFEDIIASNIPFVQLICEDGGRWLHISWHPCRCPREVIRG